MNEDKTPFQEVAILISSLRGYREKALQVALGLIVMGGVIEALSLAALTPVLSLVLPTQRSGFGSVVLKGLGGLGIKDSDEQLLFALAGFAILMVLRSLVLWWRDRNIASIQFEYIEYLQNDLMGALCASSWQDIENLQHAKVTQALGAEINRAGAATQMLFQNFIAGFMLLSQWLIALIIAPPIAALAIVLAGLGGIAFLRLLRSAQQEGRITGNQGLSMMHTSAQFLGGLKLAIAQNSQPEFAKEFAGAAKVLRTRRFEFAARQALGRGSLACGSALAGVVIMFAGFKFGLPAASLLTAFAIFSRMSAVAVTFVQSAQQMVNSLPGISAVVNLTKLLKGRGAQPSIPGEAEFKGVVKDEVITLQQVSIATAGQARLDAISLSIRHGEIVGITGSSGAGKTTFIDIVAGLLVPDHGVVFANGVLLSRDNLPAWRNRISYVVQDTFLMNDTVRRNLTFGGTQRTDEDIWWVLRLVQAEALAKQSADGLETVLSERGSRYSGGERQRIAIARALLRAPEILILDEATNAIDIASEAEIFGRIREGFPELTIIIVAHRPSSFDLCDRVLTFEKGRVIADERMRNREKVPH